jgi:hypothetical protein
MSIKTGLRALAIGVAMVCGAAGAEAATIPWEGTLSTSSSAIQSFFLPLDIAGDISEPFMLSVAGRVTSYYSAGGTGYAQIFGQVNGEASSIYSSDGSFYDSVQVAPFGPCCHYLPALVMVEDGQSKLSVSGSILLVSLPPYTPGQILGPSPLQSASYKLFISAPDNVGLHVTPIPGALPLFASVLGIGGWLGYRRKWAQDRAATA